MRPILTRLSNFIKITESFSGNFCQCTPYCMSILGLLVKNVMVHGYGYHPWWIVYYRWGKHKIKNKCSIKVIPENSSQPPTLQIENILANSYLHRNVDNSEVDGEQRFDTVSSHKIKIKIPAQKLWKSSHSPKNVDIFCGH